MALTTAPDFTDGILTPSKLQQLSDAINERSIIRVRMSADQALATSSTVLQDLTEILVAVAAGAVYDGLFVPAWTLASGTTEDIKFGFTFPSATFDFGGPGPSTAGLGAGTAVASDVEFIQRLSATSGTTVVSYGASTGTPCAIVSFTLAVGGSAGSLQAQAAQNTSGGNAVTVKAGTKLWMWRVS